jgi:hypothetical protein
MPPAPESVRLRDDLVDDVWRGEARLEVTPADTLHPGEQAAVWVTANRDGQSVRIYVRDGAYAATEYADAQGGTRTPGVSRPPAPRAAAIGLRAIAEVAARALLSL